MFNCLIQPTGAIVLWTRAPLAVVPEGCLVRTTDFLGNPAHYVYDFKLDQLLEKTEEVVAREAQEAAEHGAAHEAAHSQKVGELLELVGQVKDAKVRAAFTALLSYLRIHEGEKEG